MQFFLFSFLPFSNSFKTNVFFFKYHLSPIRKWFQKLAHEERWIVTYCMLCLCIWINHCRTSNPDRYVNTDAVQLEKCDEPLQCGWLASVKSDALAFFFQVSRFSPILSPFFYSTPKRVIFIFWSLWIYIPYLFSHLLNLPNLFHL